MKIFVTLFLLVVVVLGIVLAYSIDDTTLTAEEKDQAIAACVRCHGADPHGGDDHESSGDSLDCTRCHGDVHDRHRSADCMRCHPGVDGLESADNAHHTLQWAGLGVMGVVLAGLGLNFAVALVRISRRGGSNDR